MRVNLNTINNKYRLNQAPQHRMQTQRPSQVQHLREYIIAIQNQLKSFQTERKTLLEELSKFENANNNMRLEIDYLVNQLKGLDVIIDEKNGEMQKLERESVGYKQELREVREALQQKLKEIHQLKQAIKESQVNSSRQSREGRMEREILEIKMRSQVQQQVQPKIQSLTQQIHTLKLQLSQKDFSYSNLEKTLAIKAHSLTEKDERIAESNVQIQRLKEEMNGLRSENNRNQKEIQSLKQALVISQKNCKQLMGGESIKKQIINQQQRVVLVENVALKKQKQTLLQQLQQLTELNNELNNKNTSLKEECQYIQKQYSQINQQNSLMRVQLQQFRNHLSIIQNDSKNLTQQNQTLKQENLKLSTCNEQLQNQNQQLKTIKQLPKSEYESLKSKLQSRLHQLTQKQQQLKKRHWLEIARYANQIDKLKLDLEQKNKQNHQLKKQLKQQHNNLASKEIDNQSSVIILESEKQAIRIQLAHEWKEKIDQETMKLQQEINQLKTEVQEQKNIVSRLGDQIKARDQSIRQRDNQIVNKERQINQLNHQIGSLQNNLSAVKQQLKQSHQTIKQQSLHTRSLQLQIKSRQQTLALKQSQIVSLTHQLQQKSIIISQKDSQITNKQTIIKFKDEQLLRKQNNYEVEKQIMNNILQTQIKEGIQQKEEQLKKTLLTEDQVNNIKLQVRREVQGEMKEKYQKTRENLVNEIERETFKRVYSEYQVQITRRVELETQTRLRKQLQVAIRQQLTREEEVKKQRNSNTQLKEQLNPNKSSQNTPQQQKTTHTDYSKSLQQLESLRKYHRLESQRQNQLESLKSKLQENMRVSQGLVKQLNEHRLINQNQKEEIAQLKKAIKQHKQSTLVQDNPVVNHQTIANQTRQQIHKQRQQQFNNKLLQIQKQKSNLQQQLTQRQLITYQLQLQSSKLKQSIAEYQLKSLQLQQKCLQLQHQLQKIEKLLDDSHEELKSQRNLNIQLEGQLIQAKATARKVNVGLEANCQLTEKVNTNNKQLEEKLKKYQQQQIEHLEQVNSLKIQLQNITNELIESDSLRTELNKKIQTLNKDLKLKDSQIKHLRQFKQLKDKQTQQSLQNKLVKQKQAKQIKQQKQFNQQNHLLKIKHLQSQLKTTQSELQSTINQLTQKTKEQQNIIHQKELQCETIESELKAKLDEVQQMQELITLKDEEIHELTQKADALQIKYNSYFGQIEKKAKEQQQMNIFNKKKITHLTKELQQAKRTINEYQKSFLKFNQTIQILKNEILQKDSKIQSLERQAQRTKKYQQIISLKPQTLRDSPKQLTQPQTTPIIPPLIIEQSKLTNYQKIMKKQQPYKPIQSQQPSPKPQQSCEFFRRPQQGVTFPQKTSDRLSQQQNQNRMISSFNNAKDDFNPQYNPYSIGKLPGPKFFNDNPPQMFTFKQKNEDSMNPSEQDNNNYMELQQSFQNQQSDAQSSKNYFTAQYTFYKPNQNMSIVSQDNVQTVNGAKLNLRLGEGLEQKLIEKNKLIMEKSKSQKLLKNPNNVAKSIKEELNQVTGKITSPPSPISTTNNPQTNNTKITSQKTIKLQQKQQQAKVQTQKKPQQKNGGIRKNITQQNQKILNVSHERINSKDVERKTSDDIDLPLVGDTKSKSKLIRTLKSHSEMVKGQVGIVSNLK